MSKKSTGRNKVNGIVINEKCTALRILDAGQNGLKSEISNKGAITGKYRGTHWDTVETQLNPDGTSSWNVKFLQVTNKGDMLFGSGKGTGEPANSKGISMLKGEGEVMTNSERLSELNGSKWICEIHNNVITGSAKVRVTFQ
jgi:hypothetical protein